MAGFEVTTEALKTDSKIRFVRVPSVQQGGKEELGIYSGQLYYIIRDIKSEADTQPEDRLKKELLDRILGEAVVHERGHGGKDYFCAAPSEWARVLGFSPQAKEG